MSDKKISLTDWLGIRSDIIRNETRWFGRMLGFALIALALFLAVVLITMFGLLFHAIFSADDGADVRNIGLVIAALLGAPFVIWRSWVASRQAQIADESLFNDKINAAAEDLAARRQVTTVLGKGDDRSVITEWQDDLVTRAAAIDRLEGLARERIDTAPRIARMLSIYVRELSAEHPAIVLPDDMAADALRDWANMLTPIRSDMEKATQTLGRLQKIDGITPDDIPIDLRGANLQGFDLESLTFAKARLNGAQLQGANLTGAQLQGAYLTGAQLQEANLSAAQLQGANLSAAQLQGANLSAAQLQGANLTGAQLQGANLSAAQLQGANLNEAQFDEDTDFTAAVVQYAAVKWGDLERVNLNQSQVNSLYGDESVTLATSLERPAHWPEEDLDYSEFRKRWRAWQVESGYQPPAQGE